MTGNAIFLKFYIYYFELIRWDSPYEMTNIPGIQEDLTSTILTGYNVGIAKNINKSKLNSAKKVIKYITSREVQKKLVLQQVITSAIKSIYEEEDVCSSIKNCKFYRDPQPIAKPVDLTDDFNEYSTKFTNYFYDFLYRDEDPSKMLKAMDDLARVYYVNINSKETTIGLITFIIFNITVFVMLASLSLVFFENFKRYYFFLPKTSWFLIVLGIISILATGYTKIGKLSNLKCHLNNVFLSMGYSLIYIPILCRLLINFPEENKISKWINENKNKFNLLFLLINVILNGLAFIEKYNIENNIIDEGENFQICRMNRTYTMTIYIFNILYNIMIILALLLLIFIEWNSRKVFYDIRYILSSVYLNIITFIVFFIFNYFQIQNYKLHFGLYEILVYIIAVINYLTLYGIRILLPELMIKDNESEIIDKIKVHQSSYEKSENISVSSNMVESTPSKKSEISKYSSKSNSLFSKILEYHYNR